MNDDIRKIVHGFLEEGDYEKALAILINLQLDDPEDQALLTTCKEKYVASATEGITTAVKLHDRPKAEKILSEYKKLIGEDNNVAIFKTLVDTIPESDKSEESIRGNSQKSFDFSEFIQSCQVKASFFSSVNSKIPYGFLLFIIGIVFLVGGSADFLLCIASFIVGFAIMWPILSCKNNLFKVIAALLVLLSIISSLSLYGPGIQHVRNHSHVLAFPTWPWLATLIYVILYNIIIPTKSQVKRIVCSFLLFTIFDPLWYGMIGPGGIEKSVSGIYTNIEYSPGASFMITLSTFVTLSIYYFSIKGISFDSLKKLYDKILQHKKKIIMASSALAVIILIAIIGSAIKSNHDQKVAQEMAIQKAKKDSIERVEKARLAEIERIRQEKEQARRDSIDYVEHADFVAKYANIGLIITNLEMTSGRNNDGNATKGLKFTIFNPTKKTIKYVVVHIRPINNVDDQVYYDETCRGIGPVDSHDYGSWDFNDIFVDRNDIIKDFKVVFQVVYTNGSVKTIKWADAYVSSFKPSWFNGR